MKTFNKLVRDRIPAIIEASGQIPVSTKLDTKEFIAALKLKLVEEINELITAEDHDIIGEVADVLEVLNAYCDAHNIVQEDIDEVRSSKALARGTFQKRIYLIETRDFVS